MRDANHAYLTWRDLVPLVVALILGALAWSAWDRLPARLPIHFAANGAADGFAPKAAVPWMMFGLPAFIWLLVAGIGALPLGRDAQFQAAQTRAMVVFRPLLVTALLLVLGLSVTVPLFGAGVFWPVMGAFLALLVVGVVDMAKRVKGALSPEDRAPYRWGLFYVKADDPRIWVPKLIGVGWTLNFAHPASWLILLLLLAIPAALAFGLP